MTDLYSVEHIIGMERRIEELEAQVQRVREVIAYAERNYDAPIVAIRSLKVALDGDA